MKLILGDSVDKLKELDDNSIDSIVTDPPYGLSFMGNKWDYDVPSQEIFEECLRVLKPGGHLLSFAGSRTYHRMAVRVEDAGFEIRDQIMWIYGSGFPKSHNIGKSVDKLLGNEREVVGTKIHSQKGVKAAEERTTIGAGAFGEPREADITKGTSQYEGWGTALKPAHEPIVMARKPLSEKTVARNVLEYGTGGINIDGCRVGTEKVSTHSNGKGNTGDKGIYGKFDNQQGSEDREGRFPANIIFDEEAGKILDEQSGISKSTGGRSGNKEGIWDGRYNGEVRDENPGLGDVGGASRFFYCPKTSKRDRNEGLDEFENSVGDYSNIASKRLKCNTCGKWAISTDHCKCETPDWIEPETKNNHPTVKPTDLMLYLIRLVTPKGGTTLDPFMGSGSSGKAAIRGGFDFIGIEREEEYMEIAEARIQYEIDNPYIEETKTRTNVKKEVKEKINKFFTF